MKTEHDLLFDYGIDVQNRIIYLVSSGHDESSEAAIITPDSVDYLIKGLNLLGNKSKEPIILKVSSVGGFVTPALAIYDAIQTCPCPVIFEGSGAIFSAATIIMAGCDERRLTANARLMFHEISSGFDGRLSENHISVSEAATLQKILEFIYSKNSRMPESFWRDMAKRDMYLSAEEAVTLGIADKIILPLKRNSFRKVRNAHIGTPIEKSQLEKIIKGLYKRLHLTTTPSIEIKVIQETSESFSNSVSNESNSTESSNL
jgi:ATP-dependent Clp protease protease subunit